MQETAEAYRMRIMHNFDPVYYKSRAFMIKRLNLTRFFFDNIQVRGIENAAEVKDKQLVYASNHVSLADFLIQGYIIWRENLQIPRFIGGENLNQGGFGKIWKKCGTVSIDRNMRDSAYWRVYVEEIRKILVDNEESLLIYPEGGRSYSGKFNEEGLKQGTLRQVTSAVNKGKDIWIVPMKIKYDKRIEQRFLEGIGKDKAKRDKYLEKAVIDEEKGRYIATGMDYLLVGIYNKTYFAKDVASYFCRLFDQNKGNAYLEFGKSFFVRDCLKKCNKDSGENLLNRFRAEIKKLD
jgi:1-acyl-sn-glycerol-3-phosphate acyltransferase